MEALELLCRRRSVRKLTAPAPNSEQLAAMLQAAVQVPDHGDLTPYHFTVVQGDEAKGRFHQVLLTAAGDDPLLRDKANNFINMAPLMVAVIAKPQLENKFNVPRWEQELTAGCATYALQLAAKAQGFDSVWITGAWARAEAVATALNCGANDRLIALVLIGTSVEPSAGPKNQNKPMLVSYF